MQKLWSNDLEIIGDELEGLIAQQVAMTLFRKGEAQHKAVPIEIFSQKTYKMLLLRKEGRFLAPKEPCLLLYHSNDKTMRCFQATVLLETETELGIPLPHAIYTVQQYRKHRRHHTSTRSTVSFTRPGGRIVNHGVVLDVSMEGARLAGKFSHHIKEGDLLSPVTLNLRLRFGDHEERVTASSATVCRVIEIDEETREFGIHFLLSPTEQDNLEIYLSILSLEGSPP